MRTLDWYFDFVSAFAYFQHESFARFPGDVEIRYHPVLFAGLLAHHGHKGPAEIAEKRRFTYRQWVWQAARQGIPFKLPPAHPFNPLRVLRLALALDRDPAVVATIFRFIWRDGEDIEDEASWRRLGAELGVDDAEARVGDAAVKAELRAATEQAAARGLFGVPTLVVGKELFWGADATEMVLDFLAEPGMFEGGEMARASALPVGTARKV